ncbi:MAG: hypothetical protein R2941_12085 [Desulfobacterales bacterium]
MNTGWMKDDMRTSEKIPSSIFPKFSQEQTLERTGRNIAEARMMIGNSFIMVRITNRQAEKGDFYGSDKTYPKNNIDLMIDNLERFSGTKWKSSSGRLRATNHPYLCSDKNSTGPD